MLSKILFLELFNKEGHPLQTTLWQTVVEEHSLENTKYMGCQAKAVLNVEISYVAKKFKVEPQ